MRVLPAVMVSLVLIASASSVSLIVASPATVTVATEADVPLMVSSSTVAVPATVALSLTVRVHVCFVTSVIPSVPTEASSLSSIAFLIGAAGVPAVRAAIPFTEPAVVSAASSFLPLMVTLPSVVTTPLTVPPVTVTSPVVVRSLVLAPLPT